MAPNFDFLHDSTLMSVVVSWPTKEVLFNIETANGAAKIECFSVTRLTLPMEEPWGRSVSINGAIEEPGTLRIEMQSGDEIVVSADSFTIQTDAA